MEHGQTVNSDKYSAMLEDKLKPAICSKRRGLLSKTVLLSHDNARPHAAAATIETIQKLNFKLLPHSSYSPNLAPSDYHLFGSLKKALRGHRFRSDEEVKQAVHTWLCDQPKTFFSDGIKKLVEHCKKCVDKQGDYVEK
jgi:histone-lysine N-methyltransferase SETMAR